MASTSMKRGGLSDDTLDLGMGTLQSLGTDTVAGRYDRQGNQGCGCLHAHSQTQLLGPAETV